jgi:hypothetical protein
LGTRKIARVCLCRRFRPTSPFPKQPTCDAPRPPLGDKEPSCTAQRCCGASPDAVSREACGCHRSHPSWSSSLKIASMERGSQGRIPRGRGRPRNLPPLLRGRGRGRPRARGAGRGGAPRGGHEDTDDGGRHSSSDSDPDDQSKRRYPLFLRPYDEERVQPHRLGPCNAVCEKCGARCWLEERAKGKTGGGETSRKTRPLFVDCCRNGAVQLPVPQEPPPELRSLLTDDSVGALRPSQLCKGGS